MKWGSLLSSRGTRSDLPPTGSLCCVEDLPPDWGTMVVVMNTGRNSYLLGGLSKAVWLPNYLYHLFSSTAAKGSAELSRRSWKLALQLCTTHCQGAPQSEGGVGMCADTWLTPTRGILRSCSLPCTSAKGRFPHSCQAASPGPEG